MAGRVSDAQKNGFLFPARFGERLLSPRKPVHRVMLMLEEIGRFFARETIRMLG